MQFTCTNLDGSQKEGSNFLNLLQKAGGTQKEGGGGGGWWFPQKRGMGDSNPGGNYGAQQGTHEHPLVCNQLFKVHKMWGA